MREPRLELCHPDDFHALRDVDVPEATDFEVALPLLFPRHCCDDQRSPATPAAFVPFSCTCAVSCCDGLREHHGNLNISDDVIPLPVHYVAAQDDDDDEYDDDDDDDDSVYSDSNRHLTSTFLLY